MDLSNKNIIHVKNGDVEYIQFRRLLEYKDKLAHAYTLKPIDLKNKSKDDINYKKICMALGIDNENVIKPTQTHTNNVEIVVPDSKSTDFPDVDGLITNQKNKILSAVFADCNSLLLYDPVKNAIGNIHSGWRGTVAKIGEVAVKKMVDVFGCNPADIICCIGPSIRQCHFEVEDDVKALFLETFKDETIIKIGDTKDGKQKYYIDAVTAIKNMLIECGLTSSNIIDCGICTVCNNDILHSYRVYKSEAGRNGALMCLI
ncbi:MAG: peptidoglycan editing factor PgeF [Clostridia bacterium]|nr:peptidoglycan editing factor PgeF [Clostridia bacterium]